MSGNEHHVLLLVGGGQFEVVEPVIVQVSRADGECLVAVFRAVRFPPGAGVSSARLVRQIFIGETEGSFKTSFQLWRINVIIIIKHLIDCFESSLNEIVPLAEICSFMNWMPQTRTVGLD